MQPFHRRLAVLAAIISCGAMSAAAAAPMTEFGPLSPEEEAGAPMEIAQASANKASANAAKALTPTVERVRVGVHPGSTRLVLDVSRATAFNYEVSANGQAILIHLPNARWNAGPFAAEHMRGRIAEYQYSPTTRLGGRLAVLTDSPVRITRAFALATGGGGQRIVFDLAPIGTTAGAPAPAIAAAPPTATGIPRFQPAAFTPRAPVKLPAAGFQALPPRQATTAPQPPPPAAPAFIAKPVAPVAPAQAARAAAFPSANEEIAQRFPRRAPAPAAQQMPGQPFPPPAAARDQQQRRFLGIENTYFRGSGGVNFLTETDAKGSGNNYQSQYDPGFALEGALGIDMQNGFRIEAEMGYAVNDVQSISGTANGTSYVTSTMAGDISAFTLMGNLAFDFASGGGITPFVTGGVGLARLSLNDVKANGTAIADGRDWVFALQLGGGVSLDVSERLALEAAYKYFDTAKPEFSDAGGTPFDVDHANHKFTVGARYKF